MKRLSILLIILALVILAVGALLWWRSTKEILPEELREGWEEPISIEEEVDVVAPEKVIENFLEKYIAEEGLMKRETESQGVVYNFESSLNLTDEYKQKIKQEVVAGGEDITDPIIYVDGSQVNKTKVGGVVIITGDSASITAILEYGSTNNPVEKNLQFDLIKSDNQWKINDVSLAE